jgi:cation diffusion facilitator family transporter
VVAARARPSVLKNEEGRYTAVARVLRRVLALNLAVAIAKLVFGYATGAVSIVSDGFHSLSDSASNIVGLVGLRAARMPPDANHPYGHRKYETLAAVGIFIFLLLTVLEVGRAAIRSFTAAREPDVTVMSFTVMLVTLVVNLFVVRHEAGEGRRLNSELLLADSVHTRSDVLTSMAVIASLIAVRLGYPLLDPVAGLVVAGFIARTGFEIARDTSRILADQVVMSEDEVREVVMSVSGVVGCHHIRTRGSADHVFLDLHVWFPGETPLTDAHELSHIVKDRLMQRYPQIADAVIHLEPPPA